MAKVVDYFENNVTYEEGPFVITKLNGRHHCRIEVECKGHHCPILPDGSIECLVISSGIRHEGRFDYGSSGTLMCGHLDKLADTCDWLNQQVLEGKIILDPEFRRTWIVRQAA